ncbi:MAG: 2-octaprenyl-6-methoxyphenyl hydroxylase [Xanthomonadaceae bacterium]|nr:2-octaprenyl-6-methoxyphenyl hydroxylase [Xanthomonadaceae bacterium]MDE2257673.1 2-octaprenyl-6-methoxyphenyl hydroxylase [Xanthomonadaceae bacterium]
MEYVDVLIVGGGLVGASLAIALDGSGLRVALAEAAPPKVDLQPSYDERNLALARATVNALEALGVWAHCGVRATPIRKIHVSRQGEFGVVRLDAARHGVDAFGATLPARELGNGLLARLDDCRTLQRLTRTKLTAIAHADGAIAATLATADGERRLRTRLLIGADGTNSFVRSALGIESESIDYAQTAFVATVTPERAIDCAYERFTATGPVALLPLTQSRAGVVLTVPTADATRVAALDDAGFIALLHERFGWRLGKLVRPGRRVSYPLHRLYARRIVAPRAVLVGNAAQTLHPIGAQGFNLGLRDALTLAEMLVDHGGDPGAPALLTEYARRRHEDRDGTAAASDALARWTANESPPLKFLRSVGLLALDRIAPLQAALVRRGMGFRGRVPRLALSKLS